MRSAPDGVEPPLPKPGALLRVREADYLYGRGDITMRVRATGEVRRLPDGDWLTVRGTEIGWDGTEVGERQILVRMSSFGDRRGRS